jgi:8-oxo-dGTP diphosphatase
MAVYLVRHAIALGRSDWSGDDAKRPLTKRGERQAEGLVDLLAGADVRRLRSSPAVRCVDTVVPLARRLGLEVDHDDALYEGTPTPTVLALLEAVAAEKGDTVLCSHGDVIPEVLRRVAPSIDLRCAKGSTWRLDWAAGRCAAAYLPPPA